MEDISKTTKQILEKDIEDFKKSEFSKKKLDELKGKRNFLEDVLDISINRACRDMMARTLQVQNEKIGENFNEKVNNKLKPEMIEYFNGKNGYYEKDNFDKWHQNTCTLVKNVINEHYDDKYDNNKEVGYGKAQKIVNMTFKYLYCFAGEDKREQYFKNCHIPIDSYILKALFYMPSKKNKKYQNSFRKMINKKYKGQGELIKNKLEDNDKLGFVNVDGALKAKVWGISGNKDYVSWSNIKTYIDYKNIQDAIKCMIPDQDEFKSDPLAWENEVWTLAAEIIKNPESMTTCY